MGATLRKMIVYGRSALIVMLALSGLLTVPSFLRADFHTTSNGILNVISMDNDSSSPGLFTVRTGDWHPEANKDVLFSGCDDDDPCADPTVSTSYITLVDFADSKMWVNVDDAERVVSADAGFSLGRMSSLPLVFTGAGPRTVKTTYNLPGFKVIQVVSIAGVDVNNTSVSHRVTVQNTTGAPRDFGLRYLWDWRVSNKDDAWFRTRGPLSEFTRTFTGFPDPDFPRYQESDDVPNPMFSIFGTVRGGSLLTPPTEPDELRFASWGLAQEKAWSFSNTGYGDDSAIVYYWGLDAPITLAPGESRAFVQYFTTNLEALRHPIPRVGKTQAPTGNVCAGDSITYTVSWVNEGDGTVYDLTLTDTRTAFLEYEGGSLTVRTQADGFGFPTMSGAAWATVYGGPWHAGEPPNGQTGPLSFKWVIDRVAPGQTGSIQFRGRVMADLPFGTVLMNEASATMFLDATVFWPDPPRVANVNGGIELQKRESKDKVTVGGQYSYKISYFNNYCAEMVTGVSLWDTLPDGLAFISASHGGTFDGQKVVWDLGSLPPRVTGMVTFVVEVAECRPQIDKNGAQLDYFNSNGDPMPRVGPANSLTVEVVCPKAAFEKTMSPVPVTRGGALTFNISMTNDHAMTMSDMTLWDSLPLGATTFVSATSGGAYDSLDHRVDWTLLPDLAPGVSFGVDVDVIISTTLCGSCCPNEAILQYSLDGGASTTRAWAGPVSVELAEPKFSIVKSRSQLPYFVTLDIPLEYYIEIENTGTDTAYSVQVWGKFPSGYVSSGCSGPPGSACGLSATGVEWSSVPPMPPGRAYTFTVTGLAVTREDNIVPHFAGVRYQNEMGCSYSRGTPSLSTGLSQPKLRVDGMVSAETIPPGGTLTFTLSLTNTGRDTALNVRVVDTVPVGVSYVPGSCSVPASGTCWLESGRVWWSLPKLDRGMGADLSYDALVTSAGPPIPMRMACADYENRIALRMVRECGTLMEVDVSEAQILVIKQPNRDPAAQDAKFRYWLTVSNTGGVEASSIKLWDTLPVGAEFVECSGTCYHDVAKGIVDWQNIPDLESGESERYYVSVIAREDLSCTNYASASYTNSIPLQRPDSLSGPACIAVVQAVLKVEMTRDLDVTGPGRALTYEIAISNTGTGRAQKTRLWDSLPAGSTLASCSPACSENPAGTIVYWSLGSVEPGASKYVTYSVMTPDPGCASVSLYSEARVACENTGGVVQPEKFASADAVSLIDSRITLTVTPSAWTVRQGGILVYEVGYANECTASAYNVFIWDSLPAGVVLDKVQNGGTPYESTGPAPDGEIDLVAWFISPVVPPGATGVVRFSVTVVGEGPLIGPDFAEVANEDSFGQAVPRGFSNQVTVTVLGPRLEIEKTGPGEGITQDIVTFSIRVANVGNDTAFAVLLTDTMKVEDILLERELPASSVPFKFLPSSGSALPDGASWSVGTLDPGEEKAFELKVKGPELENEYLLKNEVRSSYRLVSPSGVLREGPSDSHEVRVAPRLVFVVYPNPYNPGKAVRGSLKFKGLPAGCTVRIFTLTGVQVRELTAYKGPHRIEWDGRNDEGTDVAAGTYLYVVEFPRAEGKARWKRGKIGLIR